MPTTHYNGREITTTLPRPVMRTALLAAEREGVAAAAKEANLPSGLVRYLCHCADVEPGQRIQRAFISFCPSGGMWRLSVGAERLLGVEEGDTIALEPLASDTLMIRTEARYGSTVGTGRSFRSTKLARWMGLDTESSGVRFRIEAQLDGYLARRT